MIFAIGITSSEYTMRMRHIIIRVLDFNIFYINSLRARFSGGGEVF